MKRDIITAPVKTQGWNKAFTSSSSRDWFVSCISSLVMSPWSRALSTSFSCCWRSRRSCKTIVH